MGVDLGGADVGMAEHSLDGADVGAVHEEISGEAVAKGVRRDMLSNAGEAGIFFDDTFDGTGGEAAKVTGSVDLALAVTVIEKKWRESIFSFVEVGGNPVSGSGRDENRAIFAAFTTNDELAAIKIDGIAVQFNKFGNAETAGEKEFDDGAVAETGFG